jgi:hypothetical protein
MPKSTGLATSSIWITVQCGGAKAARYGMVICWKFKREDAVLFGSLARKL